MVCHVIIPPLTLGIFLLHPLQVFRSSRTRTVSNYFIKKNKKITQRSCFTEWKCFLLLTFFLCCGCFALDLAFLAISSFLPTFLPPRIKYCAPIHASGLNESNLSCCRRKYWKPLMYFMVISCDRGRERKQQRVSLLEVEEVMVPLHLCSLPQTVTKNNGSEWTNGRGRGWSAFKTPGVCVGGGDQNCLKWSLPLI